MGSEKKKKHPKTSFSAKVFEGHKELIAFHVPFDPARLWGKQRRYFVRGTINGCPIEGEIGFRRGFHYMLLDAGLLGAARVPVGEIASFTLITRAPTPAELLEKPELAWARLAPRTRRPRTRRSPRSRSAPTNRKETQTRRR